MATSSLEQQALDRVARMYAGYDRRQQNRAPAAAPEPPAQHAQEAEPQQPEVPQEQPKKPGGLLDTLLEDKEQSLILLLLVILMKDGADLNAVLALMYLLV